MKPVTDVEKITASEDKVRKSLHELQPSANDKETLVGADRMIKSTQKSETKPKKDVPKNIKGTSTRKKVITKDKAVQTAQGEKVKIEAEDLISTDIAGPSENYWQLLAERRRIALKDTLEENKEMAERLKDALERIGKVEEENRLYQEMLTETRALVEVLQEMIEDDRNDINNSLEDSVL